MTSFFYKDQAVEFETAAKAAGWYPSAIRERLEIISREAIAGQWKHDDAGVPFFLDGHKTMSVDEYVGAVQTAKPHVILGYGSDVGEKSVDMLAEAAFGPGCTLATKAELLAAVGPRVFEELRIAWKACHIRPGIKPGSDAAKAQAEPDGINKTNNPWSVNFGGTVAQRNERIAAILKSSGTKLAASLAKSAGTTIGRPLGGK